MLVQRVCMNVISTHLPPPVMIESTADLEFEAHIMCCNGAMCLSAAPSSENVKGSMYFGFKHCAAGINQPFQGRRHSFDDGMLYLTLHIIDGVAGVSLVPPG
jgi:hypothetical protein